jgi:hypothetical protein
MSEIQFPDNWWTAGAVKAWVKHPRRMRWRLLPCGRIEYLGSIDSDGWKLANRSVESLDARRDKISIVPVLPIHDWAAGYDRAAEQPEGEFRVRERGGKCEIWSTVFPTWTPTYPNVPVAKFVVDGKYVPQPTVLGGWPAPAPTPPVSQRAAPMTEAELAEAELAEAREWRRVLGLYALQHPPQPDRLTVDRATEKLVAAANAMIRGWAAGYPNDYPRPQDDKSLPYIGRLAAALDEYDAALRDRRRP